MLLYTLIERQNEEAKLQVELKMTMDQKSVSKSHGINVMKIG